MAEQTFSTTERCHAARDGDCMWPECPQIRDDEPEVSGRHCPYDHFCFYCGEDERLGPQPHLCEGATPMTNNELVPVIVACPFCGAEAYANEHFWRTVTCSKCAAEGPARDTEAEAITAWNTRHRTRTASGEGIDAELADLRQQKADYWPAKICGCGHDHPDDVCLYHRNIVLASVAPPSELREALQCVDGDGHWLADQLEKWPARVHPDRTTNCEYLMKSAAKIIRAALSSTKAEINNGEVRATLSKFVETLTGSGRNRANMLSIDHDVLSLLVTRAVAALKHSEGA